MKLRILPAIVLLFSVVFTDIGVHLLPCSDHESALVDNKGETENESETENEAESEKEKEVIEGNFMNLAFVGRVELIEHSKYLTDIKDNYPEIPLPPPDLI